MKIVKLPVDKGPHWAVSVSAVIMIIYVGVVLVGDLEFVSANQKKKKKPEITKVI